MKDDDRRMLEESIKVSGDAFEGWRCDFWQWDGGKWEEIGWGMSVRGARDH